MCLLRSVSLSDSIWLPNACSGKLPNEELQLPQPLPVPGVRGKHSETGFDSLEPESVQKWNVCMYRFRLVPFLTELRAVMDWVWTDTTLSLSSWICVEDVYAHCFVLKCWRESEKVQKCTLCFCAQMCVQTATSVLPHQLHLSPLLSYITDLRASPVVPHPLPVSLRVPAHLPPPVHPLSSLVIHLSSKSSTCSS